MAKGGGYSKMNYKDGHEVTGREGTGRAGGDGGGGKVLGSEGMLVGGISYVVSLLVTARPRWWQ